MQINNLKEAMDKIHVLKSMQIHIFVDSNQALDYYNADKEGFFKMVQDKWHKYEQNELFPQPKPFDTTTLKDILDEAKELEDDYLTEKDVLNQHLFNIEEILTELKNQKELRKYDELKEIYDLLTIYWRKL